MSKQLIVLDDAVTAEKKWAFGGRVEMVHIQFRAGGENYEIAIGIDDWNAWRVAVDNAQRPSLSQIPRNR